MSERDLSASKWRGGLRGQQSGGGLADGGDIFVLECSSTVECASHDGVGHIDDSECYVRHEVETTR